MAQTSDDLIKGQFQDIGDVENLKLRIFHSDNASDQKLWINGGLSFGNSNMVYGSNDAGWYIEEKWTDPLNKKECEFKPVIIVEGTDCLNTGSSGNAQYQRFFHVLGAVVCGVIGIYYLKKGKLKLRYDMMKAALNTSDIHKAPYLITTNIGDVEKLVKLYGLKKFKEFERCVKKIQKEMLNYFNAIFMIKDKGNYENYYDKRSIVKTKDGDYIKYAGRNFRNFNESSQRAGHIALGEFLLAKYFLNKKFYYLFPRMLGSEKERLNSRNAKEWKIMKNDPMGNIITLEDLEGVPETLKKDILKLKDLPLGGPSGGKNRSLWERYMKDLHDLIKKGVILIKEESKF